MTSSPLSGLFFFLVSDNCFYSIATRALFRKARKKGLNFAKFHTRGGRGRQRAHPRIEVPLPPGTGRVPGRGRYRAARGAATPGRRAAGAHPGRGGYPAAGGVYRARRGLPGGRLRPGRYGAHVGRGYPGRAYTGRRGYRAKQAAFRGARRRLPGRGLSGRLPGRAPPAA